MLTRKLEDEGTCSVDTVGRGRSLIQGERAQDCARHHQATRDGSQFKLGAGVSIMIFLDGKQPQLPHPAWTGPGDLTEVIEE